ncbi:Uncharacterised protein [Streptococcus salivarius]|nr:Uncharacterised protein [Streptococcus salivarius]VUW83678.1 Uncharacterised protein [Streptococcus thermophilus]
MRPSSKSIIFFLYFSWFTFAQLLILSLLFLNYSSFNLSFDFMFSGISYIITKVPPLLVLSIFWGLGLTFTVMKDAL